MYFGENNRDSTGSLETLRIKDEQRVFTFKLGNPSRSKLKCYLNKDLKEVSLWVSGIKAF